MTSKVNLLGLIQGWSFQEKKGSAFYNLFQKLHQAGNMCDVVDFEIPPVIRKAYFAKNISMSKDRWNVKDQLDVGRYHLASKYARDAIEAVESPYNSVIQIGSNFRIDATPIIKEREVPLFSFHDNNFSSYARSISSGIVANDVLHRAFNFEKSVYESLTRIFTMSKTLRRSFIEDFGLPEEKVVYAGFGSPFSINGPLDKSYSQKNILFVATHSFEAKGGKELLDAFRRVRKVIPDVTLTMIGKDWGIDEPGIECLGFLDKRNSGDLAIYKRCFEAASLFILPSHNEAFGEVFIEAMSYGVPCIGTRTGVMPELIEDNDSGFVVDPGDSEGLTNLIIELIESEEDLRKLGKAGFRAVSNEYQWSTVTSRIIKEVESFV